MESIISECSLSAEEKGSNFSFDKRTSLKLQCLSLILIMKKLFIYIVVIVCISSCKTIPKNAVAVAPFEVQKYLGTWYEIARFDFRFEKDLNNTTANYTLNPDGTI